LEELIQEVQAEENAKAQVQSTADQSSIKEQPVKK
jgi:hypothetical protein